MAVHQPRPLTAFRSPANHYTWGTGCDGWMLSIDAELAVIEESAPPGASEEWHVHDRAQQFFYLLDGQAEIRTDEGVLPLSERSGVAVPAGVAHQFANTGECDAVFLVISAPAIGGDRRVVPEPES